MKILMAHTQLNEKTPMRIDFDVDIDLADRDQAVKVLPCVPASIQHADGSYTRHNTGVYLQRIPMFPLTGISSIDYKTAEAQGWFKIDLLNNSIYQGVKSQDHLDELMNREPIWELLEHPDIVIQLAHVNNYPDLLAAYKPRSVEELAMIIAMVRPAKKHLIGQTFDQMRSEIWQKPDHGSYYFKKSHSFAFAVSIIVQLNLLCDSLNESS